MYMRVRVLCTYDMYMRVRVLCTYDMNMRVRVLCTYDMYMRVRVLCTYGMYMRVRVLCTYDMYMRVGVSNDIRYIFGLTLPSVVERGTYQLRDIVLLNSSNGGLRLRTSSSCRTVGTSHQTIGHDHHLLTYLRQRSSNCVCCNVL